MLKEFYVVSCSKHTWIKDLLLENKCMKVHVEDRTQNEDLGLRLLGNKTKTMVLEMRSD